MSAYLLRPPPASPFAPDRAIAGLAQVTAAVCLRWVALKGCLRLVPDWPTPLTQRVDVVAAEEAAPLQSP